MGPQDEKVDTASDSKEIERVQDRPKPDPVDEEQDPELRAHTWIALAAFFLLNYTQVVALQGPSAVVCPANSSSSMKLWS